jgi:pyruvate formate lyase activating enzyme
MRCPFCQNNHIAAVPQPGAGDSSFAKSLSPSQLAEQAIQYVPAGNIGVAYTYNEPLINYEYLYDCALAVRGAGLKNVLVTNGLINPEPLEKLLPLIDAMNIDVKGFTDDFYVRLTGRPVKKGTALQAVKETVLRAHKRCPIEITTLIVPGENESHAEPIARWLAGIDPGIPLHLSRFFPRHRYAGKTATPPDTLRQLAQTARRYLRRVHTGNL